jgi:hypothetical protein
MVTKGRAPRPKGRRRKARTVDTGGLIREACNGFDR